MKFQNLFSLKNKKKVINLWSAELAQRVVKDNYYCAISGVFSMPCGSEKL